MTQPNTKENEVNGNLQPELQPTSDISPGSEKEATTSDSSQAPEKKPQELQTESNEGYKTKFIVVDVSSKATKGFKILAPSSYFHTAPQSPSSISPVVEEAIGSEISPGEKEERKEPQMKLQDTSAPLLATEKEVATSEIPSIVQTALKDAHLDSSSTSDTSPVAEEEATRDEIFPSTKEGLKEPQAKLQSMNEALPVVEKEATRNDNSSRKNSIFEFLQDDSTQRLSAIRLVFLSWALATIVGWGGYAYLQKDKQKLPEIPQSVMIVFLSLMTGKVVQKFGEKSLDDSRKQENS